MKYNFFMSLLMRYLNQNLFIKIIGLVVDHKADFKIAYEYRHCNKKYNLSKYTHTHTHKLTRKQNVFRVGS